ncbi:MAG: ThuA domain-containing protein [Verrucomicrobiales bacterium]|nr:ThuA domain-containing protein [Verrucomicrobiales bacterium]
MSKIVAKLLVGCFLVGTGFGCATDHTKQNAARPLKILLVTGGCCHNYPFQSSQLTNAVQRHAAVQWTVVNQGGSGTRAEISLYDRPDWSRGFDLVIHNECFADTTNPEYIRRITAAHAAGTPAVVIHCAMHTYRATDIDNWREFLGVTSRRHDHMSRYPVRKVDARNPVVRDIPEGWTTPMDELYVIEKLWPNAKALAVSKSEKDGNDYPVIWTNRYGKARVFGTTYGHSDDTFSDPVFLEYVSRGVLWAAGRLE